MKDIINEFQSNLPPSARWSAETIFFRSLPARAYWERSFREQKILIMTYPWSTPTGDTSDKPSGNLRWQNWQNKSRCCNWRRRKVEIK